MVAGVVADFLQLVTEPSALACRLRVDTGSAHCLRSQPFPAGVPLGAEATTKKVGAIVCDAASVAALEYALSLGEQPLVRALRAGLDSDRRWGELWQASSGKAGSLYNATRAAMLRALPELRLPEEDAPGR